MAGIKQANCITLKINNTVKSKWINSFMLNGNKHMSEKILLKCFKTLSKESPKKINFKDLIKTSVINASPFVHVRSARRRRRNFQMPYFFNFKVRSRFAIKSVTSTAKSSAKNPISYKIAKELLKASTYNLKYFSKSTCLEKKKEFYQLAQINKSFAHYRWF